MHLLALLENFSMKVFQVASLESVPYVKVGSTKAMNRWDLSSQHVTPTTTSFLEVPVKFFILAILCLLLVTMLIKVNLKEFVFMGDLNLVLV